MITKPIGGYVLRQVKGHPVVYVTMPDKTVRKILNIALTDETASAIVYGLGASIGSNGKVEKVGIGR
jgi:hypothetical protein